MKHSSCFTRLSLPTLLGLALLLTVSHMQAQVVFDGFTDGSSLNNPGSAQTGQLDIPWIRNSDSGTNTSTTTVSGFGSGNVMNFPSGGPVYVGTFYSVVGTGSVGDPEFVSRASAPSINLGNTVNDSIRLSFDFRPGSFGGVAGGRFFDVGLFNSNGTPLVDNGVVGGTNDSGYWVQIPGDGNTGGTALALRKVSGTGIFDTGSTLGASVTAVGNTILADTNYEFRLDLRRVTAGATGDIELTYSLNGNPVLVRTDTSVSFSTFDQIALRKRNNNSDFYIDNVSVIPEPSTFALLGLGLAAIGLRRKRRSQA